MSPLGSPLDGSTTLLSLLSRSIGDQKGVYDALDSAAFDLGLGADERTSSVCVAYALLKVRGEVEQVSRLLGWKDFEELSSAIVRNSGYKVRHNLYLTKPRAQIDIVAEGESYALSIDCKHWRKTSGPSVLAKVAHAQLRRSELLRAREKGLKPIVSVILSLGEPEGTFVMGVPIVPVRTLPSFLNSMESYSESFALR